MELSWAALLAREAPCKQDVEPQQEYSSQGSRPSGLAKSQIYLSNLISSSIIQLSTTTLTYLYRLDMAHCLLSAVNLFNPDRLGSCCCLEERIGQNVALMTSFAAAELQFPPVLYFWEAVITLHMRMRVACVRASLWEVFWEILWEVITLCVIC